MKVWSTMGSFKDFGKLCYFSKYWLKRLWISTQKNYDTTQNIIELWLMFDNYSTIPKTMKAFKLQYALIYHTKL